MNTLAKTINDFLNHCIFEKNLNQKTIKSYKIDLIQLNSFLIKNKHSLQIQDITKRELRDYLVTISHLKPKSIKRKVATMKAMFNFLEFEDIISINPWRKMKIKIKEPKQLPKVMDIKEVKDIFTTAYGNTIHSKNGNSYSYFKYIRNIVVIELLFATGARVSEIANLKKQHVNIQTGTVLIQGKGNKERVINICNKETLKVLQEYHKMIIKKVEQSEGFFLINRLGNKLSDQSIRTIVRNLSKKTTIQKNITPHIFRHTFATLLLEKDVDIKYIQAMLGHSSIVTTQIYTHVNSVKQRQILKSKHPRKDLVML
ncbi:MAG: tyrosine-type recombinase/integrase [Ignavibacteriae bacterium]|nr:integrase [Ignavibacteriota bacterium]NOG99286.1 tyrosine-type recombinase/integrase [Ignavibacteriota bacterium]